MDRNQLIEIVYNWATNYGNANDAEIRAAIDCSADWAGELDGSEYLSVYNGDTGDHDPVALGADVAAVTVDVVARLERRIAEVSAG
jgi:hypothetical protein